MKISNLELYGKNRIFGPQIEIWGPNKRIHFLRDTMFRPRPEKVVQRKKSHWFPDVRIPKVLLHPPKKWIFGQKTAKFGPKLTFLAKY